MYKMAASAVSKFIEPLSVDRLVGLHIVDLCTIADHYGLFVPEKALKAELLVLVREGTYCTLYHLLHLAYAAHPYTYMYIFSIMPLDLCVLGSCCGIVRLLVRYYCTVGTRSTSISLHSH